MEFGGKVEDEFDIGLTKVSKQKGSIKKKKIDEKQFLSIIIQMVSFHTIFTWYLLDVFLFTFISLIYLEVGTNATSLPLKCCCVFLLINEYS